jgi:DNA-binding transcriptional LysR family regulator
MTIADELKQIEDQKSELMAKFEAEIATELRKLVDSLSAIPAGHVFGAEIKSAVSSLNSAIGLTAQKVESTKKKRFTSNDKRELLAQIIAEFRKENPKEKNISVMELSRRAKAAGISAQSVSVFFADELEALRMKGSGQRRAKVYSLPK